MIIIDGFNLIYKFPDFETMMYRGELENAMNGLVHIMKEYQQIKKEHIKIIFDGKKKPADNTRKEKNGNIDIYYSHDYSADYIIKEFVKKDPNPKMATVITSDKEIIFYVNRFKAKVITSEDYSSLVKKTIEDYHIIASPEKEDNPVISKEEMSYWEKLFSRKKR